MSAFYDREIEAREYARAASLAREAQAAAAIRALPPVAAAEAAVAAAEAAYFAAQESAEASVADVDAARAAMYAAEAAYAAAFRAAADPQAEAREAAATARAEAIEAAYAAARDLVARAGHVLAAIEGNARIAAEQSDWDWTACLADWRQVVERARKDARRGSRPDPFGGPPSVDLTEAEAIIADAEAEFAAELAA